MFFDINSHSDFVKANLAVGAVVLVGMAIFKAPVTHAPFEKTTANGQSEIIVEAGDFKTHYSLADKIDAPLLVVAIAPQRHRDTPLTDYHSEFVTFSAKSTRKYMKNYAGQTHCPAPFLNRHADHISLYAANAEIAETLSKWRQSQISEVSQWEVINVTGQCLGKRTKIERKGEDITDSIRLVVSGRKASRACHMIYVEGIERTKMPIETYMKSKA